ncbi:MAG: glycoside hydrolase [Actinomycetota bacterium]|nr:glycoside hydrolase [Actinomycetota bacterium]MDQ6945233.1 glycoside hydrolase [Actinomycetota bacterium]
MTNSSRRLAAVAFAATLLATAPGLAVAAPSGPLRVTKPLQATNFDPNPARTFGSPSMAIDPQNALDVFASAAELRANHCGLMRSTDGGQHWGYLEASPSIRSYQECLETNAVTQGRLAFGRNHTLYYLLDGYDITDGGKVRSVLLGKSTDYGATWSTTIVSDNHGKGAGAFRDKPVTGLAVDTSGSNDIVYVGWRREFPGQDLPPQPMVAVSTDGGTTFSTPLTAVAGVFDTPAGRAPLFAAIPPSSSSMTPTTPAKPVDVATNFGGVNPRIVVDNKGAVHVLWIATTNGISDSAPLGHYMSTSTDHGKTFTVTPVNPFSVNNTSNYEVQLAWSPDGGPSGTLHVVYEGTNRPEVANWNQIFYRNSTDGGATWTPIKVINDDDPSQLLVDRIPDIRTAPNGRIDVVWWSTRDNPATVSNDAYYAYSSDNGATWSKNIRISDVSVNRKIGPFGNNFDLWAPPGLASTNAYALVGWDDTRNGNTLVQTQDIYTAAVQYNAVGGKSATPRYLLAGSIGLLVAGVIMVGLVAVRRRKSALT